MMGESRSVPLAGLGWLVFAVAFVAFAGGAFVGAMVMHRMLVHNTTAEVRR